MKQTILHLTVSGRVQGVGFRYYVQTAASALGITGYVRNLYNGDVEIYGEGEENKLIVFLQQIQQGPSLSRITNIHEDWATADEPKYKSFVITH